MSIELNYLSKLPIDGKIDKIKDGYNFRCPICGDSNTNQFKKRGYLLLNNVDDFNVFVCHNESCELDLSSKNLVGLLGFFDQSLVDHYKQDISSDKLSNLKAKKKPKSIFEEYNKKLTKFDGCGLIDLNDSPKPIDIPPPKPLIPLNFVNNMCFITIEEKPLDVVNIAPQNMITYLNNRNIEYDPDIMYWSDMQQSIVFLFLDQHQNCFGYQRRMISKKIFKIALHDDSKLPKIFGIQKIKKTTKRIYIFESIFNTLSVEMCEDEVAISILGTKFTKDQYEAIYNIASDECELIFCLDPDEAGVETTKKMSKVDTKNQFRHSMKNWKSFKYFIYPKFWNRQLDINDVRKIMSSTKIKEIIDANTFNYMKAYMKLIKL